MPLAIQITAYGGPEQLELVELPVGDPGPGEIRIRHQACGLNFIDVYQRTGLYANPLPLTLGMEGAGIVEAVGEGVKHLQVGDRAAYASQPPGSYSQVRVMPAKTVCRLPDAIDFETGAAMMLKGLTAQYLLKKTLPVQGLQPGDHVLFHAAAGGVGLIACQWARALGLQLIGTAGGAAKCELALQHGAAFVIDYTREDVTRGQQRYDVILQLAGTQSPSVLRRVLTPMGTLVMSSGQGRFSGIDRIVKAFMASPFVRQRHAVWVAVPNHENLVTLKELIDAGKVTPIIDRSYPLRETPAAVGYVEAGHTRGRVAIAV